MLSAAKWSWEGARYSTHLCLPLEGFDLLGGLSKERKKASLQMGLCWKRRRGMTNKQYVAQFLSPDGSSSGLYSTLSLKAFQNIELHPPGSVLKVTLQQHWYIRRSILHFLFHNTIKWTVQSTKRDFWLNTLCVTKVISTFFKLRIFLLVNVCLNYKKKNVFSLCINKKKSFFCVLKLWFYWKFTNQWHTALICEIVSHMQSSLFSGRKNQWIYVFILKIFKKNQQKHPVVYFIPFLLN